MLYISLILFLISKGSLMLQRMKNPVAVNVWWTTKDKAIYLIASLHLFSLVFLTLKEISNYNFFWTFVIALGVDSLFSIHIAKIYCKILGYKSKPTISYLEGGFVKHNLHLVDAIITFTIGLILYFLT